MITIILFILIGLKLEMGAAYWCIVGIAAALVVVKGLMQIYEAAKQHKEKQKIVKELDAMIDKLEKNRDKLKSSMDDIIKEFEEAEKRKKEEENEEKKKAEEYGFCELKDTENWEPAYKAGVWKTDKERKAKVDREQNENQEETKHE